MVVHRASAGVSGPYNQLGRVVRNRNRCVTASSAVATDDVDLGRLDGVVRLRYRRSKVVYRWRSAKASRIKAVMRQRYLLAYQ